MHIEEKYHGDHRRLQEDRQRAHRRNRRPLALGEERPDRSRGQPLGGNEPSHRVYGGRVEIGTTCSKRSNEGRDYLSLKLDDRFTAPIFANLFDEDSEGPDLLPRHWRPRH